MTAIYNWEPLLECRSIGFQPRGATVRGSAALSGRAQVAEYDAGFWVARASGIAAVTPEKVRAYRRFRSLLRGGANMALVPVFDLENAPWVDPLVKAGTSSKLFSDGTDFTDGTGFYNPGIVIKAADAASARSTIVRATITTAGDILGGEYFSYGLGRLHQIEAVISGGGTGDQYWMVWPPLREDLAANTKLNFDNPTCRMRLQAQNSGDVDFDIGRFGFPDMDFEEVWERPTNDVETTIVSCLPSEQVITAAGDVVLAPDCADIIIIQKAVNATTQVTLPSSKQRLKSVTVVDGKGTAATYNITIVPPAGETLMTGASYILDSNGSSLEATPRRDGTGWY